MWAERFKRIILVIAAGIFLLLAGKVFAEMPTQLVAGKLEKIGQNVLERAVDKAETTKIIESQTKEIMEIIKQLPQNQVDQIKKQIFKDFCKEVLGE